MTQYREHFVEKTWYGKYRVDVRLKEPTDESGFTPSLAVEVRKSIAAGTERVYGKHYTRAWTGYTNQYGDFKEDKIQEMVETKLESFARSIKSNIRQEKERQETEQERRDAFKNGVEGADLEQIAALGKEYRQVKDD